MFGDLEARVGIEPTHKGFADLSLTAWVPRPGGMFRHNILCREALGMPTPLLALGMTAGPVLTGAGDGT